MNDIIVNKYITKNPYFNDGRYLTGSDFTGFFLHSVGCSQPDPLVFINGWNKASYTNAGVNGFIGEDYAYVVAPCLETPGKVKRMPHAGSPANNHYIGFEMCEPSCISYPTGGSKIVVSDANLPRAQAYVRATYRNAVELFARLCTFHGKNPLKDGVILSHAEGAARGIATNHGDPEHLWNQLKVGYTMDTFRKDVAKRMEDEVDMTKDEVTKMTKTLVADQMKPISEMLTNISAGVKSIENSQPKFFKYLKDALAVNYARPTLEKLVDRGYLKGKAGTGETMQIDLYENEIRMLVILDRAGAFDQQAAADAPAWEEK